MHMHQKVIALCLALTLFAAAYQPFQQKAEAVSAGTTVIQLYLNKKEAIVNNQTVTLDSPVTAINGRTYVPVKFLSDYLGFSVSYNAKTKDIVIQSATATIQLNQNKKTAFVNGTFMPFSSCAVIKNDRLLVQLTWVGLYMGAKYNYDDTQKRVDIYYVRKPDGVDLEGSSKPVAKFYFSKDIYKIGEPVKYNDISYDPDADGIVKRIWTGNQQAFYKAGTYDVTLYVIDSKGNMSNPYTRSIVVVDSLYLSQFDYPIYYTPVGNMLTMDRTTIEDHFKNAPYLPAQTSEDITRKLLVSDSPETITTTGILYQDVVNGKARLYANHINGMSSKVQFMIAVTNNTNAPVTVTTTNKGEVYPSIYANLIGHVASMDFLLHEKYNQKLVVPAGQTLTYVQMPDFFQGSGVNAFYDLETTGEVTVTFAAMDPFATADELKYLQPLGYNGHVRGTFPLSEKYWELDASSFTTPSRITIGDGTTDVFTTGLDAVETRVATNKGNYGVVYHIHANHPRRMAMLLVARGGPFKGPIKINGEFIMVPKSGVVRAYTDVPILARFDGTEDELDIEFTPPAGSAFPIDIIFYPLEDK